MEVVLVWQLVHTPFLNTFKGAGVDGGDGISVGMGWNHPEKLLCPPETGLGRKLSSKSMMESLELLEHEDTGLDTPEKNDKTGLWLGVKESSFLTERSRGPSTVLEASIAELLRTSSRRSNWFSTSML